MADGESVTKATEEAAAAVGVAATTVQRWASVMGRPLSRFIQDAEVAARTSKALAARRAYSGADYRRAADDLMTLTRLGIDRMFDEIDENCGQLPQDGMVEVNRLSLSLGRAIHREEQLFKLGFGIESTGTLDADQPPFNMLNFEEKVAEAREVQRLMVQAGEARMTAQQERLAAEQERRAAERGDRA